MQLLWREAPGNRMRTEQERRKERKANTDGSPFWEGIRGSYHYGVVRKPSSSQGAVKIREAKAAVDKCMGPYYRMCQLWMKRKSSSRLKISVRQEKHATMVHLASLMDLQSFEEVQTLQGTSKNIIGSCAPGVTTSKTKRDTVQHSQSKAHQLHKVQRQGFLGTISKLPGMTCEASVAVSAYTQVKMTDAPRLLSLPKEQFPNVWIRIPPRQRPKSWDDIEDPVFSA